MGAVRRSARKRLRYELLVNECGTILRPFVQWVKIARVRRMPDFLDSVVVVMTTTNGEIAVDFLNVCIVLDAQFLNDFRDVHNFS